MSEKIKISIIFLVFFGGLFFSQINRVFAKVEGIEPLTKPLTYPVTYYIRGRVFYRILGWYKPAVGATVKAENTQSRSVSKATVGEDGQYAIGVNETGIYKVRAFDSRGTIFRPLVRFVEIIDHDITGINFVGTPRF